MFQNTTTVNQALGLRFSVEHRLHYPDLLIAALLLFAAIFIALKLAK